MNILFISNSFFELTETFIYHQVEGCEAHSKILIANEFKHPDVYKMDLASKYRVPFIPKSWLDRVLTRIRNSFGRSSYRYSVMNEWEVIRIIQQEQIDVIHCHFGPNGIRALPLAKKTGLPLIVSFHGYDASELLRNEPYRIELRELYRYAAVFITVSSTLRDNLESCTGQRDKIMVIPYGVDLQKFRYSTKTTNSKLRIFHVGRLVAKKGVPDLVKVFGRLVKTRNDIELHIVGDGPDMGDIHREIELQGIEKKVVIYGARKHQELVGFFAQADIFVLNSRTSEKGDQEGLPNTLLEAMASGCAVISTRHSGIGELINCQNGVLIDENDQEALENALSDLIIDTEKRLSLGRNARAIVESHYNMDRMLGDLQSVYNTYSK